MLLVTRQRAISLPGRGRHTTGRVMSNRDFRVKFFLL
jgi:hypothetical protein